MSNRKATRTLGLLPACAAISAASLLSGCSTPAAGPREFTIAPGRYQATFDAARNMLLDMHFELERIDAAGGVISTAPHYSRGLFEPWDDTQSSLADEWGDATNMQAREVRVSFTQAGDRPTDPDADTTGSVWVTLYRNNRSGRRLDSEWVGGSTFAGDPLQDKLHASNYLVPIRRDEALEARLVQKLAEQPGVTPLVTDRPGPPSAPDNDQARPAPRPRAGWYSR